MPSTRKAAVLLAAVAILAGWTWPSSHALARRTLAIPILMYHRIGPHSSSDRGYTRALTVTTSQFGAEMEWLHRDGYHAIDMQQLDAAVERGAPLPAKPIVITFDDGYRDVLWNAAPILWRLHMPATEFVITGRVSGPDPSFLTWPELHLLEARGFTIGSHTVHHLELPRLSPSRAAYELIASRRALQRHLHREVPWFAYPAGRFDPEVVSLVRRAGYRLAFTTLSGDVQSQPLLLHRYEVLDTTGPSGLRALLGSRS